VGTGEGAGSTVVPGIAVPNNDMICRYYSNKIYIASRQEMVYKREKEKEKRDEKTRRDLLLDPQ
jgi:hypothetical protein